MTMLSVKWGSTPTLDASSLGEMLGSAAANGFGPTPMQKLKIDHAKLVNQELMKRAALIEAQTGLTGAKTDSERQGFRGREMASSAAGDLAAGRVAAPAIVEAPVPKGVMGPGAPVYDKTQGQYQREQDAARRFAMGNTLASINATDMANGAGITQGMIGTIAGRRNGDIERQNALLYTHKAPDTNDVLSSYDTAGVDAQIRLKQAEEAAKPHNVIVNGLPYQIGPANDAGQPTLQPYANAPELPYGTGDKADVAMAREKARIAAGEDPTTVRKQQLDELFQGQHQSRASVEQQSRDIIVQAHKNPGSIDPLDYEMATRKLFPPKVEIRNDKSGQPQMVEVPMIPPGVMTPQEYAIRSHPRAPQSPLGLDARPVSPIISPEAFVTSPNTPQGQARLGRDPLVTPLGPQDGSLPPLTEGPMRNMQFGLQMMRAAAYFDKVAPTDIPSAWSEMIQQSTRNGGVLSVPQLELLSPRDRMFFTNALFYLNPELRWESGAAISPTEYDRRRLVELPMPGDSSTDLAVKQSYRAGNVRGMLQNTSPKHWEVAQQEARTLGYDLSYSLPVVGPQDAGRAPPQPVRSDYPERYAPRTPDVSDGMTATNPKTGERLIRKEGQWVPLH